MTQIATNATRETVNGIVTPDILNGIKAEIETQLLKRGFTAPLTMSIAYDRHDVARIEFVSEKFQTTPVIFKDVVVDNFNSSLTRDTSDEANEARAREENPIDLWKVWLSVHVSYNHFTGGSNGCELFSFHCSFRAGETLSEYEQKRGEVARLWDVQIRG